MLSGLTCPGVTLATKTLFPDRRAFTRVPRGAFLKKAGSCVAQAGPERRGTRLGTRLTTIPRRIDYYFAGSLARRWLWTVIAFVTGFYAANTVSLSFGALSINDVVAAAVTVLIVELSSYLYHSASKKTLRLVFLNAFKWGICFALITDAFKLAG